MLWFHPVPSGPNHNVSTSVFDSGDYIFLAILSVFLKRADRPSRAGGPYGSWYSLLPALSLVVSTAFRSLRRSSHVSANLSLVFVTMSPESSDWGRRFTLDFLIITQQLSPSHQQPSYSWSCCPLACAALQLLSHSWHPLTDFWFCHWRWRGWTRRNRFSGQMGFVCKTSWNQECLKSDHLIGCKLCVLLGTAYNQFLRVRILVGL